MTATASPGTDPPPLEISPLQIMRVSVPQRSVGSELRAIKIVWRREMTRFLDDRLRIVTSLVQPLLFLFILGSGLQRLSSAGTHGVHLRTFIYPGILCMSVMYAAIFSAASFVWDREFGFLREMMIAPVRRSSIIIGKCLGGTTVASLQGVLVLVIAAGVGVPYRPVLVIGVLGLQLLLAFMVTAFGLMISIRIKQMHAFTAITQMLVLPLFFLSGALFPASGLPGWLAVLNRLDPVSYVVDPMRRLIFSQLNVSQSARRALDPGLTWFGYHLPPLLEVGVVFGLGASMLAVGVAQFRTTE